MAKEFVLMFFQDSCLDELNGQKKRAAIAIPPSIAKATGQKVSRH